MKNIMHHINRAALALTCAVAVSGCNDFLEVKPLNEIVFENYWEEKADVESALFACYSGMMEYDFIQRAFIWGEMRGDDVIFSKTGSNQFNKDLELILEENILETNSYLNWTSFYQVINRCNSVIYYAPEVAEKDPNFTDSELKATIAEATWLRSLCHFYLARVFRDVPYVTQPSKDDADIDNDYRIKPTPMKELLQHLADDLESVRQDALRYYPPMVGSGTSNNRISNPYNSSRVTLCAYDALLTDIYLWLGQYDKCLEASQRVLDYKIRQYEEVKEEYPSYVSDIQLRFNKYPLILDQLSGSKTAGNAYTQIFGEGNSFESIFELYWSKSSSYYNQLMEDNQMARKYSILAYSSSNPGCIRAYRDLFSESFYSNPKNDALFLYLDNRLVESMSAKEGESETSITKFYYQSFSFTPSIDQTSKPTIGATTPTGMSNNWIFYRLSDVMLMRAEALVELDSLQEAFDIVSATYNRACNLEEGSSKSLKFTRFASQSDMRKLVEKERHRELLFEGKRWFDLVRHALRKGSNEELISYVVAKQEKNQSKIEYTLKTQDALFWPYLEKEVDLNPWIEQNPAFITQDASEK